MNDLRKLTKHMSQVEFRKRGRQSCDIWWRLYVTEATLVTPSTSTASLTLRACRGWWMCSKTRARTTRTRSLSLSHSLITRIPARTTTKTAAATGCTHEGSPSDTLSTAPILDLPLQDTPRSSLCQNGSPTPSALILYDLKDAPTGRTSTHA
jgi:hypothetical protein